ncbi:MAG: hypothetical protein EOP04_21890 [Proteobacteria bacterium]|nr:MAG: hypothetical protein EOP04_21890 [Pseudomonadota bacterium]
MDYRSEWTIVAEVPSSSVSKDVRLLNDVFAQALEKDDIARQFSNEFVHKLDELGERGQTTKAYIWSKIGSRLKENDDSKFDDNRLKDAVRIYLSQDHARFSRLGQMPTFPFLLVTVDSPQSYRMVSLLAESQHAQDIFLAASPALKNATRSQNAKQDEVIGKSKSTAMEKRMVAFDDLQKAYYAARTEYDRKRLSFLTDLNRLENDIHKQSSAQFFTRKTYAKNRLNVESGAREGDLELRINELEDQILALTSTTDDGKNLIQKYWSDLSEMRVELNKIEVRFGTPFVYAQKTMDDFSKLLREDFSFADSSWLKIPEPVSAEPYSESYDIKDKYQFKLLIFGLIGGFASGLLICVVVRIISILRINQQKTRKI